MSSNDALCDEVLATLRLIHQAMGHQSRRLEQTIGLTGPQLRMLQAMAPADATTVGELASRVKLTQGTVTSILDRLARKELIRRERGQDDRRKVHVSLTPAGRQLLAQPAARSQAQFVDAFARLPALDKTQILTSLQQLAALMQVSELDPAVLALPPSPVEADERTPGRRPDASKEPINVWNHRRHSS